MNTKHPSRRTILGTSAAALGTLALGAHATAPESRRILVVVGPSQHPPGTHEVMAGGRLLAHCLTSAGHKTDVLTEWPDKTPEAVSTIVFIGDLFPPEVMPKRDRIMSDLTQLMKAGCGMVCLHYATGLEAKHAGADGNHPLLHWIGGYFATRCTHHKSIAKVFREATIEPAATKHVILNGWKAHTIHDEPYINNYFGPGGPAKNVAVLATSQLPPEKPKRETVAWAIERPDGGRGAGIVMPHFYRNWKQDDLRTLILNTIVWSAKGTIPESGISIKDLELVQFKPAAIEPIPRKK